MSYLISLHSHPRTMRQLQMNQGFCSSWLLLLLLLTFKRVWHLFYVFSDVLQILWDVWKFLIHISSVSDFDFSTVTGRVHAPAPTGRQVCVCVWAAFNHEHNSKALQEKEWNKSLHVAAAGHGGSNRSIWPSTICWLFVAVLLSTLQF